MNQPKPHFSPRARLRWLIKACYSAKGHPNCEQAYELWKKKHGIEHLEEWPDDEVTRLLQEAKEHLNKLKKPLNEI